jgi:hypothetical protein
VELSLVQGDSKAVAAGDLRRSTDDRRAISVPAHSVAAGKYSERAQIVQTADEDPESGVRAIAVSHSRGLQPSISRRQPSANGGQTPPDVT